MFFKESFRFKGLELILAITLLAIIIGFFTINKPTPPPGIIQIDSYAQAMPTLKNCTDKSLILFDVDDTLITAYDIVARKLLPDWLKLLIVLKHPSMIKKDTWEYAYSIMWDQAKRFVFEPLVINIIKELETKGCTVMALTGMETGSLGVQKDLPEWRYSMLKEFGIQMSNKFPETYFTMLPAYKNKYPGLYKGIICCNLQPKGPVLGAFLDYFKPQPQEIIFFDDSMSSVSSVAHECIKRKIPYTCFCYHGAKKVAGTWNTRRAILQLDYMIEKKHWLTDQEADQMLTNPVVSPII